MSKKKTVKDVNSGAKVCKACKHTYMHPCDGKNDKCMNYLWVKSGKKMKVYEKLYKEAYKDFITSHTKEKESKRRVRLGTGPVKAKRVRL